MRPHRQQPARLPCPWDSPGKNTGVGCHFLLQCMKVKSESEVAQSCPTLSDPMDCSLPGSSFHGIFQARVLEWGAVAFSTRFHIYARISFSLSDLVHSVWQPLDPSIPPRMTQLHSLYRWEIVHCECHIFIPSLKNNEIIINHPKNVLSLPCTLQMKTLNFRQVKLLNQDHSVLKLKTDFEFQGWLSSKLCSFKLPYFSHSPHEPMKSQSD